MFKRFTANESGFTLMELLIAVAIVVVLAGVGIPVYIKFQAGAKHSEASTNLNGIKLSQEGYKLSNGAYVACAQHPAGAPNQVTQAWTGNADFDAIGFSTSSDVRFVYAVSNVSTTPPSFVAEALGDTDGDTNRIFFLATESEGPRLVTAADTLTYTTGGTSSDTDD